MSARIRGPIAIGIAVASLLFAMPAAVDGYPLEPSPTTTCATGWDICGDWEIGAQALYFTPIACPYVYANAFTSVVVTGLDAQSGRAQVIPCRPEWGFRVVGNYLTDCIFVGLSYQWFEVATSRSVVASTVIIQGGQVNNQGGKATGQVGIEYQNVDVRVGRYLTRGCYSALYLYGNVRWIDLSHRRSSRVGFTNGDHEDIGEKSQLEGGAIGFGFGGECDVWCGVSGFIDSSVLGVIGNRSVKNVRYRFLQSGFLTEQDESYPSETCVIPEVDLRVGLNYAYACGCWKLVGEIGYELDYFWHGSVLPDLTGRFVSTGSREFVPVCEDLGFSGLFFGARLIF